MQSVHTVTVQSVRNSRMNQLVGSVRRRSPTKYLLRVYDMGLWAVNASDTVIAEWIKNLKKHPAKELQTNLKYHIIQPLDNYESYDIEPHKDNSTTYFLAYL